MGISLNTQPWRIKQPDKEFISSKVTSGKIHPRRNHTPILLSVRYTCNFCPWRMYSLIDRAGKG